MFLIQLFNAYSSFYVSFWKVKTLIRMLKRPTKTHIFSLTKKFSRSYFSEWVVSVTCEAGSAHQRPTLGYNYYFRRFLALHPVGLGNKDYNIPPKNFFDSFLFSMFVFSLFDFRRFQMQSFTVPKFITTTSSNAKYIQFCLWQQNFKITTIHS